MQQLLQLFILIPVAALFISFFCPVKKNRLYQE